jgi:hypothetical protein
MAVPIPISCLAHYLTFDMPNGSGWWELIYLAVLTLTPIWYAAIGSMYATRKSMPVIVAILFSFVGNLICINAPDEWYYFIDMFFLGGASDSTYTLGLILLITNGIMMVFYLVLLPVGFIARTEDEWVKLVEESEKTGVKMGITFEEWKKSGKGGI